MSETENEKKVEEIVNFITNYAKPILIGLAVIFVGLFAVLFSQSQAKKAQKSAFAEYYKIEKSLTDKKEAVYKKQEEAQKDKKDKKDIKVSPGDLEKDYGTHIAEYKTFISANKDKYAAVMAAMELASLYDIFNKTDLALEALQMVDEKALSSGELLFGHYHIQLARTLISSGEYDKALSHLEMVIKDEKANHLHGAAYLKKGVVFYKTEKLDEAKDAFTRVSEQFSESESATLAKTYLKIMNI